MSLDQFLEAEHDPGAAQRRGRGPVRPGAARRKHRVIDFTRRGKRHPGAELPRGWIVNITEFAAATSAFDAVDEMMEFRHHAPTTNPCQIIEAGVAAPAVQ